MYNKGDIVFRINFSENIGTVLDTCPVTGQCWIQWVDHKSSVNQHFLRIAQQTVTDSSSLL
jgi:hypothetical protein